MGKARVSMKTLALVVLSFFCLLTSTVAPLSVFAEAKPSEHTEPFIVLPSERGVAAAFTATNDLTQKKYGFTMVVVKADTASGYRVIMNKTEYDKLYQTEKLGVMSAMLDGIKGSNMNTRDKGRLYSFVESSDQSVSRLAKEFSSDTTADLNRGLAFIRPGLHPLSILLGIIILLGFMLIAVQAGIDLLYVASPMTHFLFTRPIEKQTDSKGDTRFITAEAKRAYDNYATGQSTTSPAIALMVARIPQIAIFAIFAAVVVTGNIFTLLGFFMDIVDNVMRVVFP